MDNCLKSRKIEPVENMNSCNILNENKIELNEKLDPIKNTKIQIKSILSQNLSKSSEDLELFTQICSKIVLDKYPGFIHIEIDSIEKLNNNLNGNISLQLKWGNVHINTPKYTSNNFIKTAYYFKIPILNRSFNNITILINLIEHIENEDRSIYEGSINFSNEDIKNIHNQLIEEKVILNPTRGMFGFISSYFSSSNENDPICKYYCSYISNCEFDMVENTPNSIISLSKWIAFRKYAFNRIFQGIVNIKSSEQNFVWKKQYIKWYGYLIYVFDSIYYDLLYTIDISEASLSLEKIKMKILVFNIENEFVEIEFMNEDVLEKCIALIYILFPVNIDKIY